MLRASGLGFFGEAPQVGASVYGGALPEKPSKISVPFRATGPPFAHLLIA